MAKFESTKMLDLGSCAFRQPRATSHCKLIHGYKLYGKFTFGCNELDGNHWVVDFGGLKGLKNKLEQQFDHTTCIAADDPELDLFRMMHDKGICDLRVMRNGTGIERIAEWCYEVSKEYIEEMTKFRCWVERVEIWEHEKNSVVITRG
jgi:6-pyruvoyltetrahydropterin/6-carboxytetrahydropterin synthase